MPVQPSRGRPEDVRGAAGPALPHAGAAPRASTVVVVTWRGRHIVGACLDALIAQSRPHLLLVVDNASDDGTADVLAAHPSRPRVLRLPGNRGYAGALAAALPLVTTRYFAWLNDDAQPSSAWLAELEDALDAAPGSAAAGSVLVLPDGQVQSSGVRLTSLGYGFDAVPSNEPSGMPSDEKPPGGRRLGGPASDEKLFGFCGGAALLRTDALRAVGGVPAGFFCYYEDTDTAWRLRLAGQEVLGVPSSTVTHRHGASSSIGSRRFHLWNERNRLLMLLRCAPLPVALRELARFAAITVALPVRRASAALVSGEWRPSTIRHSRAPGRAPNVTVALRLRVLVELAWRFPSTMIQRAAIGHRSTVRRRDVWRTWAGR